MRCVSLACIGALMSSIAAAAAAPCFLPTEIEADQAIRLRTTLLVIGAQCKDPSYARFLERNNDTLAAYEQLLSERFERDGPAAAEHLQTYLNGLETSEKQRAERTASYCADAFELVALANGMQPEGLRSYAASHAETARADYAICTDLGNPPAAVAAAAAPPKPPVVEPPPAPAAAAAASASTAVPQAPGDDGLVAGLADSDLARMLDPVDRQRLKEITQQTLEMAASGRLSGWRNPYSRNAGTVSASPAFKNPSGQWCRGIEQSITVLTETRRAKGTACRRPDGWWEIQP
jgi:surface antigen